MFVDFLIFILRLLLIVALWVLVWKLVKPRTQFLRILRAALLLVGFLGILAVLRIAG